MTTLPDKFNGILMKFALHFSPLIWQRVQVLVVGAILARPTHGVFGAAGDGIER